MLDTVPILVDVELEVDFPRDRKDAKFIACAQTVNADFLITGDRDFTEAQNLGRTRIISVSLFKQFFVDIAFLMSIRYIPHPKPLSQNGRGALKSTSSVREPLYDDQLSTRICY